MSPAEGNEGDAVRTFLRKGSDTSKNFYEKGIGCVFHYVPLHSAPAGIKFGRFDGEDVYTTAESDRLVRLPMYYGMLKEDCQSVISAVNTFFGNL